MRMWIGLIALLFALMTPSLVAAPQTDAFRKDLSRVLDLLESRREPEALAELDRLQSVAIKQLGADHPLLGTIRGIRGEIYLSLNMFAKAEAEVRASLAVLDARVKADS